MTERTKILRILSLGAGVQSSALLLMSARGELPKLDAAIFADTQWEPKAVYEHLEWLKTVAAEAGIPLIVTTKGSLRTHTMEGFVRGSKKKGERYATLPLRVKNPDGSTGMIKRQCTTEYKIEPIEQAIRYQVLGLKPRQRIPKDVFIQQWHGISLDEVTRMRTSQDPWRDFVYPLCGMPAGYEDCARPMKRPEIEEWLKRNYPDRVVPRSACLGCPFHSSKEWKQIKADPEEWADVVEVDRKIRHADGMNGEVFLHRSCQPLEDVDFEAQSRSQLEFGWEEECFGYCGN